MWRALFRFIPKIFAIFFLGVACWLVYKEIHAVGWNELELQLAKLPIGILWNALFFVGLDYIAFSGYDFLALHYLGKYVKPLIVLKTSFISFSLTNTTGHAYLAGGSVRYLLYKKSGLSQFDVLKMVTFESLTYLSGMGIVLDLCLIVSHVLHFYHMGHDWHDLNYLAMLVSSLIIVYTILPAGYLWKKIKLPSLKIKLMQFLVGAADCIASSLVFYILFYGHLGGEYFYVASIFLMSQIIGIASQVPGGLGVFEAAFLCMYPHTSSEKVPVLAVLISFRVLYYFVPLLLSCMVLCIDFVFNKIHDKKCIKWHE